MTDARDNRRGGRRLWVWPVAILVSFPIGGYLADLVVDGVDSVWAALVGGPVAGLVIGAAEWFALRRLVSWLWIAATSIGMAAGLTAGKALVDSWSLAVPAWRRCVPSWSRRVGVRQTADLAEVKDWVEGIRAAAHTARQAGNITLGPSG